MPDPVPAKFGDFRPPWSRRSRGPRVRWSALATGSLLGLAVWATLYLLGAAVACSVGLIPSVGEAGLAAAWAHAALGAYGCLAASLALGVASYSAARTGGAGGREEATFYGLCVWGMSTLTLLVTALLASNGYFASLSGQAAAVFEVGLTAVGLQVQPQGVTSPAPSLWAMLATVATSLLFAVGAARRAVASAARCLQCDGAPARND